MTQNKHTELRVCQYSHQRVLIYHKPITMSYTNKRSQMIIGKVLTDKINSINLNISKREERFNFDKKPIICGDDSIIGC